jgi:arginase
MTRTLSVIGAPSSAGAYAPGQERAPDVFRHHGLIEALGRTSRIVHDRGDVDGFRWRPDPTRPKAMNIDAVSRTAAAVADKVAAAIENNEAALVLGGDCTVELGTIAGALRVRPSVGLIYIDLDVDLNPPEASDGALDWTGVAHVLDLAGTQPSLSRLAGRRPMLQASEILFFGPDAITDGEARTIEALNLSVLELAVVKADPAGAATRAAKWADRFDCVLVHLDVDVLAFTDSGGTLGEPVDPMRDDELACAHNQRG